MWDLLEDEWKFSLAAWALREGVQSEWLMSLYEGKEWIGGVTCIFALVLTACYGYGQVGRFGKAGCSSMERDIARHSQEDEVIWYEENNTSEGGWM